MYVLHMAWYMKSFHISYILYLGCSLICCYENFLLGCHRKGFSSVSESLAAGHWDTLSVACDQESRPVLRLHVAYHVPCAKDFFGSLICREKVVLVLVFQKWCFKDTTLYEESAWVYLNMKLNNLWLLDYIVRFFLWWKINLSKADRKSVV